MSSEVSYMMKEKYETLPAGTLRELAKARGIKGVSALKKDKLIERMLEEDEKEAAAKAEAKKALMPADTGEVANGILEVMPDGYGFIRSENFLPGESDIYVAPSQIRRFNLKTGDIVKGNIREKAQGEKYGALLYVGSVNGMAPDLNAKRPNFEDMTPIFPNERIRLERPGGTTAMRIMDLVSPIGKGQRCMIVSPPKAG